VGKIFVKFESKTAASDALRALAGRKFSDRTVVVTYFGEVSFLVFICGPPNYTDCSEPSDADAPQEYFDVNAW
jgi:splicing factor U2AF subunit